MPTLENIVASKISKRYKWHKIETEVIIEKIKKLRKTQKPKTVPKFSTDIEVIEIKSDEDYDEKSESKSKRLKLEYS